MGNSSDPIYTNPIKNFPKTAKSSRFCPPAGGGLSPSLEAVQTGKRRLDGTFRAETKG